jgi:glycosyltransferase involved in cell wall biosynthesis
MPRVGWVGATSHRSGDLEVLQGVLGPWMRQRDAAPLVHAGHRPGARQTAWRAWAVHADEVVAVNLQPAPTYPMLLGTMDVGLVPLRMAPFNMAKSNIKGLEYAAAGVPFIATPTDEYRRLATEGVGLLAARPAHWRRHLDGLMDAEHRQRVADMARAYVLDQYDARRCIGAWDKLVLELAG